MKICFICHANICRSFSAERLLKAMLKKNGNNDIEVISRGFYASPNYEVPSKIKDFLHANGADYENHFSTQLSPEDLETSDLIFVMEYEHREKLFDEYSQYTDKIFLLLDYAYDKEEDMPDPISKTGRAFNKIMEQLKKAVEEIYKKITA